MAISDCTCDGINALKDLTDLYIENSTTYIERKSKSNIYGKKVKNIADRIYNQLTTDELTEKYMSQI